MTFLYLDGIVETVDEQTPARSILSLSQISAVAGEVAIMRGFLPSFSTFSFADSTAALSYLSVISSIEFISISADEFLSAVMSFPSVDELSLAVVFSPSSDELSFAVVFFPSSDEFLSATVSFVDACSLSGCWFTQPPSRKEIEKPNMTPSFSNLLYLFAINPFFLTSFFFIIFHLLSPSSPVTPEIISNTCTCRYENKSR